MKRHRDLELSSGTSAVLGSPCGYLVERLAIEVASVGGVGRHEALGRHVRVRVVYRRRHGRFAGEVAAMSRVADEWRVRLCRTAVRLAARPRRYSPTHHLSCLFYTSPSPRDRQKSRMPSSA